MTIPAWLTLLLAAPTLIAGEWIVGRVPALVRYSIPVPVVGGLLIALGVLASAQAGSPVKLQLTATAPAWHWWMSARAPDAPAALNLPFLAAFFATVGLSANWSQVRRVGRPVLIFLGVVTAAAVLQNVVSVALARPLGVSPLFALLCGAMSLTGGHATTLGFAAEFEKAGQAGAQTFGIAAATMGLVLGALVAGPVGSALCRRFGLRSTATAAEATPAAAAHAWRPDWRLLWRERRAVGLHLLVIAVCLKAGAWISYLLQRAGVVFPIFIGTLLAGVVVRALLDRWWPRRFDARIVTSLAAPALAVFIATAMMTLDLRALAATALPMLILLAAQLAATVAFGWLVTFRAMGSNYEAAVMTCGYLGFGLGSTATAVASMKAMTEVTGPAPQAFLVVPLVGGFLVDLVNAANITVFINLCHG